MNNLEGRTVLCFSEAVLVECATRLSESEAESRRRPQRRRVVESQHGGDAETW